ncbi:hypothetical protein [Mycobacteroides abscessus]|uniref:hypothetical protein n=1 Tax=Mycobacteroides abscessus TaxID=36809 RepID=UPI000C256DD3|nr:hypothetical protein [Mycobacteroides abscessus]MBN7374158.1 hypothetical protein [Mycobacteroides abscessus subsp. abscessus]RIR16428.1 hypothetical protein D2E41_26220 [Mycobacteroides abscessus]
MGLEEVARVCADGAETIHAVADEFATAPRSGLGLQIDALLRRNHAATAARLLDAEATLCEVSAEATARCFEKGAGPAPHD